LGLRQDLAVQDGALASFAWPIKAFDSFFAILLDAPLDTIGGYAKRTNDIHLLASSLANQLSGEHTKRWCITIRVLEDRFNTAEVRPRAFLSYDANSIVDAAGTIGGHR
jgi:hypothetical protein